MTQFQNVGNASVRRFLTLEMAMAAFFNGLINIGMAHAVFGGKDSIALMGTDGLAFDLVATTFFTGSLMVLLLTPILRRRVARGSAPSLARRDLPWPASKLPRNTLLRAVLLGAAGTAVIVPAMVTGLNVAGLHAFAFDSVVVFKAVFGALLGVAAAPQVILPAISS